MNTKKTDQKNTKKQNESQATMPPDVGYSRFRQIAPFLPFGRDMWIELVKAKKAPPPIRISSRCVCYSNAQVHRFLADPLNYTAE